MASRSELKQQSRERILVAAAELIRQHGIEGANVNAIMEKAGLTRGSFYAHFANKDELIEAAFREAMQQGRDNLFARLSANDFEQALSKLTHRYCHGKHRDEPGQGCVMAALGSEIGVHDETQQLKQAFAEELCQSTAQFEQLLEQYQQQDPDFAHDEKSLAFFSSLVGSMVLARACGDKKLSNKILAATKKQTQQWLTES